MGIFYKILEKVGFWWGVAILSIITLFVLRYLCAQTYLVTMVYFTIEELTRLSICVISYNDKTLKGWRPIIIFASTITVLRLFNEVLYLTNLTDVNNPILLAIELPLILISLWLISKHYHSL